MQGIHSNKSGLINSSQEISLEQKKKNQQGEKKSCIKVWFNTGIMFRILRDFTALILIIELILNIWDISGVQFQIDKLWDRYIRNIFKNS